MTVNRSIWPDDFSRRVVTQFGVDAGAFIDSLGQKPAVSFRVNSGKNSCKQGDAVVPWCDTGFFLDERPVFAADPLWHAGAYYVQEAGSMFIEQIFALINRNEPLIALDLCASPGGKSTHMSSLLGSGSLLVSNEAIRSRLPMLLENMTKWGSPDVLITNGDAADFGALGALFDILVIDAPCSGEGLFRKNPSAAREWSAANARLCAARQRRILLESWKSLKNGGYLIYSTCTFNPAENEENLYWFASQARFTSMRIPIAKEWNIEETEHNNIICYRFLPYKVQSDGFFIALLQKNEDTEKVIFPRNFKTRFIRQQNVPQRFMTCPEQKKIVVHDNKLMFINALWEKEILYLHDNVSVVKTGTAIGTQAGSNIIPHHELAMSLALNREAFPSVELTRGQALKYLQREPFVMAPSSGNEWRLVTYNNITLGFVKTLKNRFNNYYPKEWRLRMKIPDSPVTCDLV